MTTRKTAMGMHPAKWLADLLCNGPQANNERASTMADIGKIAYDAYAKSTGGLTYDGRVMPEWSALTDRIQDAWRAAAQAILDLGRGEPAP